MWRSERISKHYVKQNTILNKTIAFVCKTWYSTNRTFLTEFSKNFHVTGRHKKKVFKNIREGKISVGEPVRSCFEVVNDVKNGC
jgi:hypothetical protein